MSRKKEVDLNLLSKEDKENYDAIEIALTNLRLSGNYNKPLWDGLVARKRSILDFYRKGYHLPDPEPEPPTLEERIDELESRITELEERFSKLSEI